MAKGKSGDSVPLKEHVDALLAEKDKALVAALNAQGKTVDVLATDNKEWRATANEWRGAMNDRERNFVPIASHEALAERVLKLEAARERESGKDEGVKLSGGLLVTVVSVAVGIIIAVVAYANYASGG